MKNKARATRLRRKMRARALRQATEARRIVERGIEEHIETRSGFTLFVHPSIEADLRALKTK